MCIKKFSCVLIALVLISGIYIQCGSTASTSSGGTVSASDAQTASAATNSISTLSLGSINQVNQSQSVQQAVKAVAKGLVKQERITFNETVTLSCSSGSMSNAISGTIDVSNDGGTIDMDMTTTFNNCAEAITASTCSYNTIIDGSASGSVNATLVLSDNEEDISLSGTISFSTASACSGLTITVDGSSHTCGFDFSASALEENEDPDFSGTICCDNEEINIDNIEIVDECAGDSEDDDNSNENENENENENDNDNMM